MAITDFLERNARLYGQEIALVELNPTEERDKGVTWRDFNLIEGSAGAPYRREMSWSDFDRRANRFANLLLSRGFGRGTKVAILLMNCLASAVVRRPESGLHRRSDERPLVRRRDPLLSGAGGRFRPGLRTGIRFARHADPALSGAGQDLLLCGEERPRIQRGLPEDHGLLLSERAAREAGGRRGRRDLLFLRHHRLPQGDPS